MEKKNGNFLAIAIMFFLFMMISFVTGLQNPFGVIVKQQFSATNLMSQLGNAANFIAYAFMGLPAGLILSKKGYKFTALSAVAVGLVGVTITFLSGKAGNFGVYLLGAFVSGFSMCMLNTVVNPMLNTLGGGGNKGNQLIQWGGSCNSLAATICPVFVGYLIGEVSQDTKIADANPALFIAMGIFALAFIIILLSDIPEPELAAAAASADAPKEGTMATIKGALSYKHFVFGIIAIFLYVGVEVGIPNFVNLYNAGYNAAKAVFSNILVMPHLNNAFDDNAWWFSKFMAAGGKMDMIALSHYPQTVTGKTWQQANDLAVSRIQALSAANSCKVMVSEVGIKASDLALGKQILTDFIGKIKSSGSCSGIFYWEPEVYGGWKPAIYTTLGWNSYDMGCFTAQGAPSDAFLTLKNN